MNDKLLIEQLKALRNVHPDQSWVDLTRSQLHNTSPQMAPSAASILGRIFAFPVPKIAAIPVMAAVVALIGGVAITQEQNYNGGDFVAAVRYKSLSIETREELKEIAASVNEPEPPRSGAGRAGPVNESALSVVFDKDGDAQESFKSALRSRIEAKVNRINDLFAQLEDESLAREISLNARRYEENFKLADEEIGEQVKTILADAQVALEEGNLIDALDLMNAIERLLD